MALCLTRGEPTGCFSPLNLSSFRASAQFSAPCVSTGPVQMPLTSVWPVNVHLLNSGMISLELSCNTFEKFRGVEI